MKHIKPLLRLAGFLAMAIVCTALYDAGSARATKKNPESADLIKIDNSTLTGKRELPPVYYPHDLHVQGMRKNNKNCGVCHIQLKGNEQGQSSYKYMRTTDKNVDLKELYHKNCITCHAELGKGPQLAACRSCHISNPEQKPAVLSKPLKNFGYDSALHEKHADMLDCASCHHYYDAKEKKLVWSEDDAQSCSSCHKAQAVKNPDNPSGKMIPSLKSAGHNSCVSCHAGKANNKGPVDCRGCHTIANK